MTITSADTTGDAPQRVLPFNALTAPIHPRTWRELMHVLLDFPIGVAGFSFVVVFLATGLGLAITIVGIPLLAGMVLACRAIAAGERARARALLGERVADPPPFRQDQPGFLAWMRAALLDGPGWRGVIYLLLLFPWATTTFAAVSALLMWAGLLITYPIWLQFVDEDSGINLGGHLVRAPWEVALAVVAGVVGVFLIPWLVRGIAVIDQTMVRSLLGPWTLANRVRDLEDSREQVLDTAAADLRRIERDLHDGAQARLVALAMDLGMARDRLTRGDTPEQVATLVAAAHDELKIALAELRGLARGIHPAVLTDRGLDPALSAVAARCTVPVSITVDLPERPPAPIEQIAYFCVSELLVNISKHSNASQAVLLVSRSGDRLLIEVRDDGVGGADPAQGSGLAGLMERVEGIGGRLVLASPPGGPTVVNVELPCVS